MRMRVLTIGAVALFSIVTVGMAVAQERQVLQEGYSGTGTGLIGSGPGGGIDNSWMRELLVKPETIYGRLVSKDFAAGKIYVEVGGGTLVTVDMGAKTNRDAFKNVGNGNDVEIQAYRTTRRLGEGAFTADVPEGNPIAIDVTVIRAATNPSALVPQAGYQPDTDRGINATSASTMGGVGGQCFNCYDGQVSDYEKK